MFDAVQGLAGEASKLAPYISAALVRDIFESTPNKSLGPIRFLGESGVSS